MVCVACLIASAKLALADGCADISEKFDGKWTYTQLGVNHKIEFNKGNSDLIQDEVQKKMWLCNYYPDLNIISFSIKNDYSSYRILVPKTNTNSLNENVKLSINFKDFDLTRYSDQNEAITSGANSSTLEADAFKWEPLIEMDGHIFPSLILSTATLSDSVKEKLNKVNQNNKFEILGDPLGLFTIAVNNVKPDAKVKIEVSLGDIANDSIFEGVLKQKKIYAIKPKIDYKFQQLSGIREPTPINIKFTIYVDGEKVGEQFKTATVVSVNDAPKATIDKNGHVINDFSWVYAAYVNENNLSIDSLLREAINTGEINGFVGYQSGPQGVYQQVYSIWNVLQRRGLRYSSITTPTAYSDKVFSQYVRFMDDTLNTSQANCIDGTVLFASILRRIGINPKIVLVPGHAFLGFDLDQNGHQVGFLETTMMGLTDLGKNPQGQNLDDKFSKALGFKSVKNQKSSKSFIDALNKGSMELNQARAELIANTNPNYKIIDVDAMRKIGIASINH